MVFWDLPVTAVLHVFIQQVLERAKEREKEREREREREGLSFAKNAESSKR